MGLWTVYCRIEAMHLTHMAQVLKIVITVMSISINALLLLNA